MRPLLDSAGISDCMKAILCRSTSKETKPALSNGAARHAASVLEYLAAAVLQLAGDAARHLGSDKITPRHIFLAIKNDAELSRLYAHAFLGAVVAAASHTEELSELLTLKEQLEEEIEAEVPALGRLADLVQHVVAARMTYPRLLLPFEGKACDFFLEICYRLYV
jgi:hypothetical protein